MIQLIPQERIHEHIEFKTVDVPGSQIQDQNVEVMKVHSTWENDEVIQLTPQERISDRIDVRLIDTPGPQCQDQNVEVVKALPVCGTAEKNQPTLQERTSDRSPEKLATPEGKIHDVKQSIPQERIASYMAECVMNSSPNERIDMRTLEWDCKMQRRLNEYVKV